MQIYRKWIDDYGIDGYRIDTTRHVNGEFWQAFNDGILDYARANGKPEFFMFGEAAVEDEVELSMYTTRDKYQSVLDFSTAEQSTTTDAALLALIVTRVVNSLVLIQPSKPGTLKCPSLGCRWR